MRIPDSHDTFMKLCWSARVVRNRCFFQKILASCPLFSYKCSMNSGRKKRMPGLSACLLALAVLVAALPAPVCGGTLPLSESSPICGEPSLADNGPACSDAPCPCTDCDDDSHCTDCMSGETHSHQVPFQGSPDEIRPLRNIPALIPLSAVLLPSHMCLSRDAANQSDPGTSILHQWVTVRLIV